MWLLLENVRNFFNNYWLYEKDENFFSNVSEVISDENINYFLNEWKFFDYYTSKFVSMIKCNVL